MQGNQYWSFISTIPDSGYPRDISLWGLPSDIDSAFVWGANGRIYFTKGNISSYLKRSVPNDTFNIQSRTSSFKTQEEGEVGYL